MATKKTKITHRFKIDRSKWITGHDDFDTESKLLTENGAMCCIGFLAESCGVSRDNLRNNGGLVHLTDDDKKKVAEKCPTLVDPTFLTDTAGDFYSRNDTETGNRKQREQKLTTMFREAGIGVKFVGKYPKREA